jgi:hypothetical protein
MSAKVKMLGHDSCDLSLPWSLVVTIAYSWAAGNFLNDRRAGVGHREPSPQWFLAEYIYT